MKPLAEQTLYEVLEVPADASPGDVEAAYARLRALHAPGSIATYTLLTPDEAEAFTARLEEARATLIDPAARARYDERLAEEGPSPSHWPPPPGPVLAPIQLLGAAPIDEREEDAARWEPASDEPLRSAASGPIRLDREVRSAPVPLSREVRPSAPAAREVRPTPPARSPAPIPLSREAGREVRADRPPTPPPVAREPAAREGGTSEGTTWTGEVLRKVREARGISVQQISERTKVARHHIESVEADDYAALPASVYLRGILFGLARELRLDGQKVARSYLERMAAALGGDGSAPRR